jgi:hypothetical protein
LIAVVLVEPSPWLEGLLARVAPGLPHGMLTPLGARAAWHGHTASLATRLVPLAFRAAQRAWARGDAGRRLRGRFAWRRVVDHLAARALPAGASLVVAPSGAAERTFAVARARGVPTLLVHDLPVIRRLHDDLDAAARRHPDAPFLRRFRAPARDVARQEAERVLADRIVVRGEYARQALMAAGVPEARLVPSGDAPIAPRRAACAGAKRVLLAGLATTRSGTREALAALGRRRVELLVGAGEGLDPPDLLARRGVRPTTRGESATLAGVDAVVAPAWCESYPPEVALAAARGVPVIATARAAGHVDLARAGAEVAPGDVDGLWAALEACWDGGAGALAPPA